MTVSESINKVIAENGGIVRDALNVTMTKIELAELKLSDLKKENDLMFASLKQIEQFSDVGNDFLAVCRMKEIASSALND